MPPRLHLTDGDRDWTAEVSGDTVTLAGEPPLDVAQDADGRLRIDAPPPPVAGAAAEAGGVVWVSIDGDVFSFRVSRSARPRGESATRDHDALTPPMPATVVRILVKPGDRVSLGDTLVALEAMKMELPIRAPRDASVRAVRCAEGDLVQPGQLLVELDEGV